MLLWQTCDVMNEILCVRFHFSAKVFRMTFGNYAYKPVFQRLQLCNHIYSSDALILICLQCFLIMAQLYLQHILDRVVVYDDKIEIFYKYTNTIPNDSDNERRRYFSSRCEIKINKAKRSMQVLNITIDQTIHFEILYVINRRHKLRFNL